MKLTRSSYYVIAFLTLLTLASVSIMFGCNEKKSITPPMVGPAAGSGPTGGGETQRIQLLASPSATLVVARTEQATVRITALIENNIGQPMPDGTAVYWSSTHGTLDSVSTTSSNGSTSVTLTFPAEYSGCSRVTARSGDVSATIRLCVSRRDATPTPALTSTPGPTPTPSRTFIVTSQYSTLVISSGPTQTEISAAATTNGTPDVGIQVNFSVSGPGILSASAALTNGAGIATVTLIANTGVTSVQTVTVTATTTGGRSGIIQVIVQP